MSISDTRALFTAVGCVTWIKKKLTIIINSSIGAAVTRLVCRNYKSYTHFTDFVHKTDEYVRLVSVNALCSILTSFYAYVFAQSNDKHVKFIVFIQHIIVVIVNTRTWRLQIVCTGIRDTGLFIFCTLIITVFINDYYYYYYCNNYVYVLLPHVYVNNKP